MKTGEIIVQQLGGSRILSMMIGLKRIILEEHGVQLIFPKPRHAGAVNKVRVFHNGKDLYDVEFIRFNKRGHKVLRTENDVNCTELKDVFEKGTGLHIRF